MRLSISALAIAVSTALVLAGTATAEGGASPVPTAAPASASPAATRASPGPSATVARSPSPDLRSPAARSGGLPLADALKALGAELSWDSIGGRGLLVRGGRSVSFVEGGSVAYFSGGKKKDVPVPYFEGGVLVFPAAFMDAAREHLEARDAQGRFGVAAIIIDPGHGGKDPGAVGKHGSGSKAFTLYEKDVTLEVSRQVYERLRIAFPEKSIIITRSRDQYLSLQERTDIANAVPLKKDEAIIFVSIHVNSALSKNARGFEVWYLDPGIRRKVLTEAQRKGMSPDLIPIYNDMMEEEITTESILLASSLLKSLDEAVGEASIRRGIKAESWYVVRNALMPSALIELPFISNETDARLLKDPEHLRRMSVGIYNGIVSFIGYFENSKGFTE